MTNIQTQADFTTPANCAFISLPSATQQGYERASGIYVPPPPKRQEEAAAVIGTVITAHPGMFHECMDEARTRIPIHLQEGDKVAVTYMVTSKGHQTEGGFVHENAWLIKDKLVWKAAPHTLIAVERDGMWFALGENVLLKKIFEPNPDFLNTTLIVPDNAKEVLKKGVGELVSGLDLPAGIHVVFDHAKAATYQFADSEEYLVISKSFIFGYIN